MKYSSCTDYWLNKENFTFRGEFDLMYKEIEDPWFCLSEIKSLNNTILLEIIFHKYTYSRILDIGCGLGGLTNELSMRNQVGEVIGCDISPTAIEKAKLKYPNINFCVKNILKDDLSDLKKFDLVVITEIIWYLLNDLELVFEKIFNLLTTEGKLAIFQSFPDDQKFGLEIINGITGFEDYLRKLNLFEIAKKYINIEINEKVLLLLLSKK